jgi:thiol-disulfide isomerase/thioredoxin
MIKAIKDYAFLALAIFVGWYALATFFPSKPDLEGLAPSMVLHDPEGEVHDLMDLRGKPVVINFLATWCPPCVEEIPGFAAFSREHPELHVLGVAMESGTAAEIRAAAKKLGIPYTVLLGDRPMRATWDIGTLPTTVFVGADGKVLGSVVGGVSKEKLEAELEKALAGGGA